MRRSTLILLVIAATGAVFLPVVTYDYVGWDDFDTIAWNSRLRPPTWQGVGYYWTHADGGLYVPLTYTVWAALAMVAKAPVGASAVELNPAVFHAASVIIHILTAVVVFDLLRRMLKRDGPACIGALLFALHPLQVETVAWASGMKDLLCGLFTLLAVRHYWLYVAENRGRAHFVIAMIAQILAMLAKPTAVVVPLIAAAMDLWIGGRPWPRVLRTVWPMLALTIPCAIVARMVQSVDPGTYTPLWPRPLIAADAIAFYLWKLVGPWSLSPMYGRAPVYVMRYGIIYYTWLAPAAVLLLVLLNRRRMPQFLGACAIFVAGMLPVLGLARFMFQRHSTVADHYMYLPMLGVALATGLALARRPTRAVYGFCAAVLVVLAGQSLNQSRCWQDSLSLFSQAVAVTPDSAGAQGNLGRALAQADRLDEAIPHFITTVELAPDSYGDRVSLTQALLLCGKFEEALPHARAALRLAEARQDPNTAWEHVLLARALSGLGQWREAETHLAIASQQNPDDRNLATELESVRRRLDSLDE